MQSWLGGEGREEKANSQIPFPGPCFLCCPRATLVHLLCRDSSSHPDCFGLTIKMTQAKLKNFLLEQGKKKTFPSHSLYPHIPSPSPSPTFRLNPPYTTDLRFVSTSVPFLFCLLFTSFTLFLSLSLSLSLSLNAFIILS